MCGRTAQGLAPAQIRQQLDKTLPSKPADSWIGEEKYRTSYNVAPTRYQPVVRFDAQTNTYVVHLMRWGLIPKSTKSMPDYSSVLKSINARDDSLFMGPTGKAMFSHSKNYKRCILLAEGFYEWRRRGKERVPFYTKRRDNNLMLMAAIYDVAYIQGSEEPLYTYATITTNAASPHLDWLHDRMPVLIPNHDLNKIRMWLDPKLTWNSTLEAMLKPCDEYIQAEDPTAEGSVESVYALETYQVDEKVNSVRNDSPDFTKPWNSSSNKKTLNRFFFAKPKSEEDSTVSSAETSGDKNAKQDADEIDLADNVPWDDGEQQKVDVKDEADEDQGPEELNWEREQEKVSVEADDNERDAGFVEQEAALVSGPTSTSDVEDCKEEGKEDLDDDLKLALELSRKEHEDVEQTAYASSKDTLPATSSPIAEKQARRGIEPGGSSNLLEKRRKELQQEDEEMNKVLEMSRLQAIADGHEEDVKDYDTSFSPSSSEDQQPGADTDDMARKEQEELEKAIAASLNEAEMAGEPRLSQQSATSTASSAISSPDSKKASTPAATPAATAGPTTPKKRKPTSSTSSPASKSRKANQDVKITNFFQHTAPS
ncbi:hypothetical protein EDD11_008239 [Mortierella claussenii]|nr:hypothetical protein EDD11_008239 [Mortierella claussenii]